MRIPILPSDLPPNEGDGDSTLAPPPAPDPDQAHQSYWLDHSDALAQTGSALAQMPAQVSERLEQAKQQAGPGAAGFTGLALDAFDAYHQQTADTLPPASRSAFTLAAKPYRDFIGQGALQYEAQQRLDWRAGQYTESADMWADQVARSPTLLPLADAALKNTQPLLDPDQNTLLSEYSRDKLVQAGVAGALAQDAPGLLKTLGGSTDMPGSNDADTHPQPGTVDLDHPLVKLMTPAEREHYGEVARIAVLQQQATQRETLKTRTADATQSYLDTGTAKNPPMLSEMINHFGQEEGSQRYREMQDAAMLGQTKQRILPLPQGELTRLRGQAPAEDDLQGQRSYKALTGAIDSIEQERRTDPIGTALKNNSYGLSPIKDFNDAAAVAAELGRRQRASATLRSDYDTEPTVLSREENQLLLQTIKTLPPEGQGKVLQQFAQGLNDPALMDSAMRVLSAQAPVQALAGLVIAKDYAGSEDEAMGHLPLGGDGRISAGQTMLEGEAARNPPATKSDAKPDAKPLPMPPDGQTRAGYAGLVGDRFADQPGAEEAHYQAALAAYAGLSKSAGASSGEFNAQRWNAAVKLATEGSGTARELGLVPQPQADDASPQRMRNMFAEASTGTISDAGGQTPEDSDAEIGVGAGDSVQVALGNAPAPVAVKKESAPYGTKEALGSPGVMRTLSHINPVADPKSLEAKGIPIDRAKIDGPIGREDDNADDNARLQEETTNLVNWTKSLDDKPGERQRLRDSFPIKTDEERAQLGELIGYLNPNIQLSNQDTKDAAESRQFIRKLEGAKENVRAQLIANLSPEEARQFGERVKNAREGDMSEADEQDLLLDNGRHGVYVASQGASFVSMARLAGGHPATPLEPEYSRLRDRIANVRASMRSNPRGSGNTAAGDVNVEGMRTQIAASSRIHEPTEQESASGIVGSGPEAFKSSEVPDARNANYNRRTDAEAKILNHVAIKLGNNSQARGSITIMTERPSCESCSNIIQEFREKYPRIRLTVIDNDGKFIFPIPRGTTPVPN